MCRQQHTNIWKKKVIVIKSSVEINKLKNADNYVDLPMMLEARETRVARQEAMLKDCSCLVCFTMNIAGPYKISDLIKRAYAEGVIKLLYLFEQFNIKPVKTEQYFEKTGVEGYIALQQNPLKIKELTVQIEDNFYLGRLFDIDVIKPNGEKVSRGDIGLAGRSCMICGSEGSGCARSRTHTVDQLQLHAVKTICDYFNNMYADYLAQQAVKALMYEVAVTPKPGLVDRADNGAHKDMNFFTFIDSSTALYDYFKNCALKAIELSHCTPQQLFSNLRFTGLEAERKMFANTIGVNTHKGAIFSLGIITAAAAYLSENKKDITADSVLEICSQMAQLSLADFENTEAHKSFGKQLYAKSNIKGIRGQAAAGYPDVKPALEVLKNSINSGEGYNTAGLKALCRLMMQVEDTNVIKRSDTQTLEQIKAQAKEIFEKGDIYVAFEKLNDAFTEKNISPGGCADLLAVCYLLYFIGH